MTSQQLGGLAPAVGHREREGGAAVVAGLVWAGAVGEQELDQFQAAIGGDRRKHDRGGMAVVVAIAAGAGAKTPTSSTNAALAVVGPRSNCSRPVQQGKVAERAGAPALTSTIRGLNMSRSRFAPATLAVSAVLLMAGGGTALASHGGGGSGGGGGGGGGTPPPTPAGAPAVSIKPSSVSFGLQPVGTPSAPQTVTVINAGTASLFFNAESQGGNDVSTSPTPTVSV